MTIENLQDTDPWEWPEDAGDTLRKIFSNRAAELDDRIAAAHLAGDLAVMNDAMAEALLALLQDASEPEPLRAIAAISFGAVLDLTDTDGFDDPEMANISEETFTLIKNTLFELYGDTENSKEVRRRILEASVRAPEAWHNKAILEAYGNGDRDWQLTAVFAMRWVQGFDKQILESLNNPDEEIHFEAVNAAGEMGLDGAWKHIEALVRDTNTPKPLLLAAIEAVSNIKPKKAVSLLEPLTKSDDEDVSAAAEDAIMMAEME